MPQEGTGISGASRAEDGSVATKGRKGSYQASKEELAARFSRLQGQISGIARMVEEERYCPDVLTQISSAVAALEKIGFILLREHIANCVVEDVARGKGDETVNELMAVVHRFAGR
ncbi:MAG: CsoR family transcriptional regulator, copper-sensing transcriptional repressor [Chloroflexota bacterium]|jgi:DNA-binding FrmR family transcriptional regulator|nr:CsoR family transcriptional regulator, copper-sensing transcriptional repressor [Chloroflexota bacterium]